MKQVIKHTFFAFVLAAGFATSANAQQTAFDQNNQNRAIGLANTSTVIQGCLADARSDGFQIESEARGNLVNGTIEGWTVAFFTEIPTPVSNDRVLVGYVNIDANWIITEEQCVYSN